MHIHVYTYLHLPSSVYHSPQLTHFCPSAARPRPGIDIVINSRIPGTDRQFPPICAAGKDLLQARTVGKGLQI